MPSHFRLLLLFFLYILASNATLAQAEREEDTERQTAFQNYNSKKSQNDPDYRSQAAVACLRLLLYKNDLHELPAFLEEYEELQEEIRDENLRTEYLFQIARAQARTEHYSEAVDLFLELIPYYEARDSIDRLSSVYSVTAQIYAATNRLARSNEAYETALDYATRAGNESAQARDLHNYALNYVNSGDTEKSLELLRRAAAINRARNNDNYLAANYGTMAEISMQNGEFAVADSLYALSAQSARVSKNFDALYTTYYHLGVLKSNLDDFTAAEKYLTEADSFARTNGMESLRISLQHGFYFMENERGNYEKALAHYQEYRNGEDSLAQVRDNVRIGKIIAEQERRAATEKQELQLKNWRWLTGAAILAAALAVFFFWQNFRHQRLKTRLANLENSRLKEDLKVKEQELMGFIFARLQQGNERSAAVDFVNTQKKRSSAKYFPLFENIIRHLGRHRQDDLWDEFELRFKGVHKDFFAKLGAAHPDLTAAEKRTCALLFLQMNTKEISALTGQTLRAVEQQRTRIRKKCELTGTKEDLSAYLLTCD